MALIKMYMPDGSYKGDYDDVSKTYIIHRYPEHYMIKFQAHGGISQFIIDQLIKLGCEWVQVLYHGKTGEKTYKCKLDLYVKSDKTHPFNGTDLQKFVSTRDMESPNYPNEHVVPFSEDLHKSHFDMKELTIKPHEWKGH